MPLISPNFFTLMGLKLVIFFFNSSVLISPKNITLVALSRKKENKNRNPERKKKTRKHVYNVVNCYR